MLGLANPVLANIRLPRLLNNNMVLQRDMEIIIWGWADDGEEVVISFLDEEYSTTTDKSGKWEVKLPEQRAGGPYDMIITGKNTIKLSNILIGDVWICSGQSNMHFKLKAAGNSYLDIEEANFDHIRLFTVEQDSNYIPKADLRSGCWELCNPETAEDFSAVGYFFGRELHQQLSVPIGLIHASWGGSLIQAWMDGKTLKEYDEYKSTVMEIEGTPAYFDNVWDMYETGGGNVWLTEYYKQEPGLNDEGDLSKSDFFTAAGWKNVTLPGYWEESVLDTFNGTVWFRKLIVLPKLFRGKELSLNLGWIDDYDITFVNGEKVGNNFYKGTNRRYLISKEVTDTDTLEILVAVYDASGKGGFWGPKRLDITVQDYPSQLNVDLTGVWQFKTGLEKEKALFHLLPSNPQPKPRAIPTFLYNAMIAPVTSFAIKGVIWYQGEGNAGEAIEYKALFPAMIQGWRNEWNQGDFPFLFAQLANYGLQAKQPAESNWAELRDAQLHALSVPNTGMAVTIDLGDAMDVHPVNKYDVGKRLSLAARKLGYNEGLVFSGPLYESMSVRDGKVYLKFTNTGNGLFTKNKSGYLNEFAISGPDGKYCWAKAYIEGEYVVVYSPKVPKPTAVRYAWSDNPDQANLYNREGLPASPFRTD